MGLGVGGGGGDLQVGQVADVRLTAGRELLHMISRMIS